MDAGHTASGKRRREKPPTVRLARGARLKSAAVLAFFILLQVSAAAADESLSIRPGQTVTAQMPAGHPTQTSVEFLLTAEADGPLTVETSTLEFDTKLEARLKEAGAWRWVGSNTDTGGIGWNSRLVIPAKRGERYRFVVRPELEDWGGEFTLAVTVGEKPAISSELVREYDLDYWDTVEAEGERSDRPDLLARASLGRGSVFLAERNYAYAAGELESAYYLLDEILGPVYSVTVRARNALVRSFSESDEVDRAIGVLRHAVASSRARASSEEVSDVITVLGDFLRSRRMYREAADEYREALGIVESLDGADATALVPAIARLAHTSMDLGEREEAAALFDRALTILATNGEVPRAVVPPAACRVESATDPAAEEMQEAVQWELRGRWPEARELYERVVELRERELGSEHPLLAEGLVRYAELVRKESDYPGIEAKPLLERANAIDPGALDCGGRALLFLLDGKKAEAEAEAKATLARMEESYGADSLEAAKLLDLLVEMLGRAARAEEAFPLAQRVLKIKTEWFGELHPDMAWSRFNLGYVQSGNYNMARAMRIWERTLGPEHWLVGAMLNNIANNPDTDPDLAVDYMRRALDISLRHFGPAAQDPGRGAFTLVSWMRWNLASALRRRAIDSERQGDLEEALRQLEEATAAMEQAHRDGDIALYDHHVVSANLYVFMGDFASALRLLERGLESREVAFGTDDPRVADVLVALGDVHREMDNRAQAEHCYRRALAIRERRLGPAHADVGMSLYRLAGVLDSTREPEKLELYERARAIWEEAHGSVSCFFVAATDMLAGTNWRLGRIEEARALYERAVEVVESVRYESYRYQLHGLFSDPELHYGKFLVAIGEDSSAEALLEKAIEIQQRVAGPDHPRLLESLLPLAELFAREKRNKDALRTALRAEGIRRESVRLAARSLAERRALRQASMDRSGLDLALSLCDGQAGDTGCGEVWDAVLRSRALVLDEMALRNRVVAEQRDDPEIARLADELASAARRLANLTVRGIDPDDVESSLAVLERARSAKERAEEKLAEKSAAFARELAGRRAGLKEVAASLPVDSALIGFVRYRRDEPKPGTAATQLDDDADVRSRHYAAFLLLRDRERPVFVPLGPAREIESLVLQWRSRAARGGPGGGLPADDAERAYRLAGSSLRTKVWDPLVPHLRDVQQVFVVPDGPLHLVNFSAFPVGDSGYLVEQRPTIHHLSTERDLAVIEPTGSGNRGLLAVGGADFNSRESFVALMTRRDSGTDAETPVIARSAPGSSAEVFRGRRASCGDFATLQFEPLPGTSREVERIASIWESHAGSSSQPAGEVFRLSRSAADETAFKQLAPGRQVLHLATHGFFLGERCPSALDAGRGIGGLVEASEAGPAESTVPADENPLRLSGLALAGANHREYAGPEEDDGILTAEEISALDLSGVEWAVLSACDTGVGDVKAGEGVFGLRRAFQVAGVDTLIMSLWSVDDEATREWMTALYEARLNGDLSTAESVREASLDVLARRRQAGESTHPFYWAAFVAAGDWR